MAAPSYESATNSRFGQDGLVYLAVFLGYILLLPSQFNISIGSTTLQPFRFILIPSILIVVAMGFRGRIDIRWPDILVLFATTWVCIALFVTTEATEALTAAFAQSTDMAAAYFFARVTIRNLRDLRVFLVFMAPAIAVVGGIMIIESVTRSPIIGPLASDLTGRPFRYGSGLRMGLLRAPGPFPHPILAGVFLASFLPLYLTVGLRGWPKWAGIFAAFTSFFTVSSAALLALTAAITLGAYHWLSERISILTWKVFFLASAVFVFVAEATGAGTYRMLIKYGSLNSSSAYNRIRIWQYGTDNVEKNPWFGLGYADWERPEWMSASLDHFWLNMAVRFGALPPIVVLFAVFLIILYLIRASMHAPTIDRRALVGLGITVSVFAFGAMSASLWGSVLVWFFALLGLAMSISLSYLAPQNNDRMRPPLRTGNHPSMRQFRPATGRR